MRKRSSSHFRNPVSKRTKMNIPTPPPGGRKGAQGGTAETHGGHQETQLDPIASGWQLAPGPPDYTHCVLPFIYERKFSYSAEGNSNVIDIGFRMTSVYDPVIDPDTGVDLNAGAGTQTARPIKSEAGDTKTDYGATVAYWDYYSSLYKYYSVIGCRYKIRIENLTHEKFFVHKMFCNATRPNRYASNWDMKLWPGVDSRLLSPMMRFADNQVWAVENVQYNIEDDNANMTGAATTNATGSGTLAPVSNPIGSPMTYFVGQYSPGDYQREVNLDDDVEIWTAVTTNPTLAEVLLLRVRAYDNATPDDGGDGDTYNREISFNITAECEYLVEFKELADGFYRPASRNPIIVEANSLYQD